MSEAVLLINIDIAKFLDLHQNEVLGSDGPEKAQEVLRDYVVNELGYNAEGIVRVIPHSYRSPNAIEITFENERAAMLFKLTYGGTA